MHSRIRILKFYSRSKDIPGKGAIEYQVQRTSNKCAVQKKGVNILQNEGKPNLCVIRVIFVLNSILSFQGFKS
jgi:hypothetical protein